MKDKRHFRSVKMVYPPSTSFPNQSIKQAAMHPILLAPIAFLPPSLFFRAITCNDPVLVHLWQALALMMLLYVLNLQANMPETTTPETNRNHFN
jgi:hypothetical protein